MQLNVLKTIKKTKSTINPRYDITIDGVKTIISHSNSKLDLVFNAFVFGYAQGVKSQKKAGAYHG